MKRGAPVDDFEWTSGHNPRFGLLAYDPATGRRRKGGRLYRTISRRNGLTPGLVRRYGP